MGTNRVFLVWSGGGGEARMLDCIVFSVFRLGNMGIGG